MRHKHWYLSGNQDVRGGAAEDQLAQTAVGEGAFEQKIHIEFLGFFEHCDAGFV